MAAIKNGHATLEKTSYVPGGVLEPGDEFAYSIYIACSNVNEDCLGYKFTDVIPEGLDVVALPVSDTTRTVTYDEPTRTLTLDFIQALDNPDGIGWKSGAFEAFDIKVRLPLDTDKDDKDEIENTATVTTSGEAPLTDSATVKVTIPVAVTPLASKTWPGSGVVAGRDTITTATIGVANASSNTAHVMSLSVTDVQPQTWEHFDLVAPITITKMPTGATQAQLFVCTEDASACSDDADWTAGGTGTAVGDTLALPAGPPAVSAGAVTGVRVVFTAGGATLPRAPGAGGAVELKLQLRDTYRSSDTTTIAPESTIKVDNCVTAAAQEGTADPVISAPKCDSQNIWPSATTVTATKSWFPDTNGNWSYQSSTEFAVAGQQSPVTAQIRATNQSPFPVHQIVITEPSATGTTDFAKFDVDDIRLTFPNGADTARVQVTYTSDAATDTDYPRPTAPATTQVVTIGGPTKSQVTSVTVTYTGGTADAPAIVTSAVAGLDLHGKLTAAVVDPTPTDPAAPLVNCADAVVNGPTGTTSSSARPCGTLPVDPVRNTGAGVKTASQPSLPANQPVTYTMRLNNNGNVPILTPTLTDPVDPAATPNPFDSLTVISASMNASKSSLINASSGTKIQITTDDGTSWDDYDAANVPAGIDGVRLVVGKDLAPKDWVELSITVVRAAGVTDTAPAFDNCFIATDAGGAVLVDDACVTVTPGKGQGGATISKDITPATLPAWTAGLPPQETAVTLRIANTGNLSTSYLQVTDADADFFDAVDFVRFGAFQGPAGANQVQVDATNGTTWFTGTPGAIESPALPAGITAEQVRGLRITFSNTDTTTNSGYMIPWCEDVTKTCAGIVRFDVSPRPTLVSDPTKGVPTDLENTATGAFKTNDNPADQQTNEATDDLKLVPGDPKIDVDKGPATTTLGPGSVASQRLKVTNNGTTWLDDVSVVDVLPAGLAYDETWDSGDGNSFTITVSDLPADYDGPDLDDLVFDVDRDTTTGRIESVRWTFADWAMPPGATIEITFHYGLEPGVVSGQTITNTMGATGVTGGSEKPLACTSPDGKETDSDTFGDGIYCTDTAVTKVIAGAAFQARKWVAGDASLGWWHPKEGYVDVGDASCPSITIGSTQYTATPCVALVERGGTFDYVLRVVNSGTEEATQMALIDNLPYQGDKGLVGGDDRKTDWSNRPTLAGAATFTGVNAPATASIAYSSADAGTWCTADLILNGTPCDVTEWDDAPDETTTAIRFLADFTESHLLPGQGIEIRFTMDVPTVLAQGDPLADPPLPIAWNSFAHAEATIHSLGGPRVLPPIEPIKVGVAPAMPAKVSVGDYVWVDTNRDGIQGADEDGIEGVTLTITGPDGGPVTDVFGDPVGAVTTDPDGAYLFDNLPPLGEGEYYTVHVDPASPPLAPYIPTLEEQGDDRSVDSSTWSAVSANLPDDGDHDPTLDFGFVLPKVSVGDYVWLDTNRDGLQDADEDGIEGVTLTLTGPGGVDVTDVFGNPVVPVTTDADGYYLFANLPVLPLGQTYTVTIDSDSLPLAPYVPTLAGVGADRSIDSSTGSATSVYLTVDGAHDPTLDFGFIEPYKVSVGDYVWFDTNRDGIQDDDEDGIEGVTLTITGPDGGPVTDVFGNPVGPVVTGPDGEYVFENLPLLEPGQSYTVHIDPVNPVLDLYAPTTPGAGSDRGKDSSTGSAASGDLTVDGAEDMTLDFGFVLAKVSVGDFVWVDTNRDGLQDDGEPGIPGVELTITGPDGDVTDVFGNPVGPVTTGPNGEYLFENLPALPAGESYTVHIDTDSPALAPYVPTIEEEGTDRAIDSSTGTATSGDLTEDGAHDPTLDFGFVPPAVAVGDLVWFDADRDGIQGEGEVGIADVTLTITGPDGGPVTDVFGNPVLPTTTDADGYYHFLDLPVLGEGEAYTVHVDPTSPALAPYVPTLELQGDDREVDSSTWSAGSSELLEDGAHDWSLDFGFVLPLKVSVGDFVWFDVNRDGLQDAGEPGIGGVALTITGPDGGPVTDVFGNPVDSVLTDGNGYYLFDNLPVLEPGEHYAVYVDATSPALTWYTPTEPGVGSDRGRDSSTGFATSSELTEDGAHDPTLDFGFLQRSPEPGGGGDLPGTGGDTAPILLLGGLLIGTGSLALLARRRRRAEV